MEFVVPSALTLERGIAALASGGSTISTSGGAAGRYAAAPYAYADVSHALDQVVEQMDALGGLIDESPMLRPLLDSPLIDVNAAQKAVQAVLADQGFGKIVRDFVGVVVANRRLSDLRSMVTAFAALVAEKRGVVVAQVETAG